MDRRRVRGPGLAPVALVLGLAWTVSASTAHAQTKVPAASTIGIAPRPGRLETEFRKIETWLGARLRVSPPASGLASADSLIRDATEHHEVELRYAAMYFRGRTEIRYRQFEPGFRDLDSVYVVARAMRDSVMIARVWAFRGHGHLLAGQHAEAKAAFAEAIRYCKATQYVQMEGFVHRGLGGIAKREGRLDVAEREFSLAIPQSVVGSQEALNSKLQRAEVWKRQGKVEKAKAEFEAILIESRVYGDKFDSGAALHDLGNIAYEQQDMAAAARNWASAAALYDSIPDVPASISAQANRAQALIHQERYDEATALLERLEKRAHDVESVYEEANAIMLRGQIARRLGRLGEAEALQRRARGAAQGNDEALFSFASVELAGVLREAGRPTESVAVLDSLLAPRGVEMNVDDRAYAWMEKSAARATMGKPHDALAAARTAERLAATGRTDGSYFWLDAATLLARCQRAVGEPDSAVATLAQAARSWEKLRSTISNYDWRERFGSGLSALFAEYGLALLDPRRRAPQARREREAFDALQAFQARTLEERMQGAGLSTRAMTRRATADSLRRGVLRPGEVLVDLVATPDTTFAFSLSKSGLSAVLLPGTKRLAPAFEDWRSATLAGADRAVVERGLDRLSRELLAPLAPSLAGARRVVVSGGGALSLWPIGALVLPGESAPLGATREIASTPSATLFTILRARTSASAATTRLLALGRTTSADGSELPGADRELRDLGADYANVTVRENKGERTVRELTSDLGSWDALHLASHSEAVESAPWRSGFLLGKGSADDAYLRAATIARMKLKAKVAVLSGCSSAGAKSLAGEGALGLSSSFLCAGTTSVVATLWPVEDRAAERYVDEFYAALARGRTVAAAALDARAALRADAATANPRDWAAFVVVGEPETKLALKKKTLFGWNAERP